MKIVVTGSGGMLGSEIVGLLKGSHEAVGVTRDNFDILKELDIRAFLGEARPDWVIHCAAYTNVDGCEKEPDKAFMVNAEGAGNLAKACWGVGARMLYVSTDYVYDGRKREPYVETDPVNPLNVYGKSKLRGEQETLKALKDALVVRTSWLFGRNGANFVEAMLSLAGVRDELKVVDDQVGSPTYAPDLADAVIRLVEADASGIVHVSNEGECSWYDYAKKIFELAGVEGVKVSRTTTAELGRPALRPAYSVLSKDKYSRLTGHRLRHWEDSLKEYLKHRGGKS